MKDTSILDPEILNESSLLWSKGRWYDSEKNKNKRQDIKNLPPIL